MSYSRWIQSRWYTYWHIYDPRDGKETRASARFAICDVMEFNAAELRKDLDSCVLKVRQQEESVTDEEAHELKGYMMDFLADVDRDYPPPRKD